MNQQAPAPSPPKLPVSLAANPKLSSWLKFSSTGQVTVSPGKVEIGQGIVTALAQIAADELGIEDGTISGPGNVRTSYWELADEVSLDRDATPGVTPKIATSRALA